MSDEEKEQRATEYVNKEIADQVNQQNHDASDSGPPLLAVITRARIRKIAKEVDPTVKLSRKVENKLIEYADYFVESTLQGARVLAKPRISRRMEIRDVILYLAEEKKNDE